MYEYEGKYVGLRGAVGLSHFFLRERVRPGDRVVDATCGNGHDTLFLARLVGESGKVWGFDVQEEALTATRGRLAEAGCLHRVELVAAGHELLSEFVSESLAAVVFNLGYLPGGDKTRTTSPENTLLALEQAARLLQPGGVILVVLYSGHPGGDVECRAVEEWGGALSPGLFNVWRSCQLNRPASAPYLLITEKAVP
jgi:ubiquinone/menaquinone biosynthesis C-methylase UbiE